jgi:hypothetical protein
LKLTPLPDWFLTIYFLAEDVKVKLPQTAKSDELTRRPGQYVSAASSLVNIICMSIGDFGGVVAHGLTGEAGDC